MLYFLFHNNNDNVLIKAFPLHLKSDVCKVISLFPKGTYNNVNCRISEDNVAYKLKFENVYIPYRIYFFDNYSEVESNLTQQQKLVMHCILSRSCNGFVREQHINILLNNLEFEWVLPFILKISDEYIMEILELIYNGLLLRDNTDIKDFCKNNAAQFRLSYARMTSYWNEFCRNKINKFHDYIGYFLFRKCFGYTRRFERTK